MISGRPRKSYLEQKNPRRTQREALEFLRNIAGDGIQVRTLRHYCSTVSLFLQLNSRHRQALLHDLIAKLDPEYASLAELGQKFEENISNTFKALSNLKSESSLDVSLSFWLAFGH